MEVPNNSTFGKDMTKPNMFASLKKRSIFSDQGSCVQATAYPAGLAVLCASTNPT